METLWMIELGGKTAGANIEVHDIRFIAADTLEAAFPLLRREWFGTDPHIDAYACLTAADGWRVTLRAEPPSGGPALFFVNLGGSPASCFGEAHAYGLFAAADQQEAERRARTELLPQAADRHIDAAFPVQERLTADGRRLWIHLSPGGAETSGEARNTYIRL